MCLGVQYYPPKVWLQPQNIIFVMASSSNCLNVNSQEKAKALKLLAQLKKDPLWTENIAKVSATVADNTFLKLIMSVISFVGATQIKTMVERLLAAMTLKNWTSEEIIVNTLKYNDKVAFPPAFLDAFPIAADYAYNLIPEDLNRSQNQAILHAAKGDGAQNGSGAGRGGNANASGGTAHVSSADQMQALLAALAANLRANGGPQVNDVVNGGSQNPNVTIPHPNPSGADANASSQPPMQALLAAIAANMSANVPIANQSDPLHMLMQGLNASSQAGSTPSPSPPVVTPNPHAPIPNADQLLLLLQALNAHPQPGSTATPSPQVVVPPAPPVPSTSLLQALHTIAPMIAPPTTPTAPLPASLTPAELLAKLLAHNPPNTGTSTSPSITLRTPNIHKHHEAWPRLVRDESGRTNILLVNSFLKSLADSTEMRQDRHHFQAQALIDIVEYLVTGDTKEALRYISHRLSFLLDMEEHGPDHATTLWAELRGNRTDPSEDRTAHLAATFKSQKPPPDLHKFLQGQLNKDNPTSTSNTESPEHPDRQRPGGQGRRGRRGRR